MERELIKLSIFLGRSDTEYLRAIFKKVLIALSFKLNIF